MDCSAQMLRDGEYRKCRHKAKVERDGKAYCGMHDPVNLRRRIIEANSQPVARSDVRDREQKRVKMAALFYERLIANIRESLALSNCMCRYLKEPPCYRCRTSALLGEIETERQANV